MGTCIRVHGTFFPWIRTGLLLAALLIVTAIPAVAQDPVVSEPAGETAVAQDPVVSEPAGETAEIYIIVRGDCLWNLAGQFYGDPLLWPQIWDANQYILDAHWIYPGDPLVIPESPDVAAQRMVGGEEEYGEEPLPGDAVAELEGEPVPPGEMVDPQGAGEEGDALDGFDLSSQTPGALVNPVDVYCAPMIVPDLALYNYAISDGEELEKAAFGTDDVVYLDGGADDGITAGDRFFVLHNYGKIKHPETSRILGWAMRQIGELEVLCANQHDATALIVHSCAGITAGDVILPWEELPIPVVDPTTPLGRCDEPSGGKDGYLVYFMDSQHAVAEGNVVVIDKGSDDGVGLGDFFAIYRLQEGHRLMLGEALVLRTERDSATVKIIHSFREMYTGDRVVLK